MVYCTLQVERLHKWADAKSYPELDVEYLAYPHRHMFHIKAGVCVKSDDREVALFTKSSLDYCQAHFVLAAYTKRASNSAVLNLRAFLWWRCREDAHHEQLKLLAVSQRDDWLWPALYKDRISHDDVEFLVDRQ